MSRGVYQVSLNTCETLSAGLWWDANGLNCLWGTEFFPWVIHVVMDQ